MKTKIVLFFLLFSAVAVFSQPCNDYPCDSAVVRQLLDTNGLDTLTVEKVAGPRKGRIDSLNLTGKGIAVLPSTIGKLTSLKYLFLGCLRYSGLPIGPYCNTLVKLPDEIGTLDSLVGLNVDGNQLTSIPATIGGLKQLTGLILSSNHLTAIPGEIGMLKNLRTLDLYHNDLQTLPDEIGQLHSLQYLNITGSLFTSVPATLGDLSSLVTLKITNSGITSLPSGIGRLQNLKYAELYHNQLTDLPDSIMQLTNLEFLSVGYNKLCSLSDAITGWLNTIDPTWQKFQACGPSAVQYGKKQAELSRGHSGLQLSLDGLVSNKLPSCNSYYLFYDIQGRFLGSSLDQLRNGKTATSRVTIFKIVQ
jgi:hypothetical protein